MEDLATRRDQTERWFVRQGLPHLIDRYSATEDVLTRVFPLMVLVVFLELFLSFGDRWRGWAQAIAFLAGGVLILAAVASANRLRGRRLFQLPDRVGTMEVLLFVGLPTIPTAIGAEGSVTDNVVFIVLANLGILVGAFVVTSWGLLPMMRWSVGQMRVQIVDLANLTLKSLPILLLFSAFIFLNAEMWQVANDFTMAYFVAVIVLVSVLGSGFVMLSVRRLTVDLARFPHWDDVRRRSAGTPVEDLVPDEAAGDAPPDPPALGRRAEWNVALLLFVAQAIQIVLVALVITAFYLLFGLLTVREETLLQWTTAETLTRDTDWAARWSVAGGQLIFTRQLVLVSAFIGAMSGLQFAVQIVTDESYRTEFAEDMTAELREALAVRAVYLRRLIPT